jgi:hypothetical protein
MDSKKLGVSESFEAQRAAQENNKDPISSGVTFSFLFPNPKRFKKDILFLLFVSGHDIEIISEIRLQL